MPQPPQVIDPLAPLLAPPGLFSVSTGPLDLPDHGENAGFIWDPDTSLPARSVSAWCQAIGSYPGLTLDSMDPLAQAWPFVAYSSIVTGPYGFSNDEAVRRVRQRLINNEMYVAERALWGGAPTLFTGLTNMYGKIAPAAGVAGAAGGILEQIAASGSSNFIDLTGATAPTVADGISLLEQAAADNYYGAGVLHARPRIAAYAGKSGQFRLIGLMPSETKTYMYSQNLNAWNFGNGYAGTGPTGQAVGATTEYMWATGRIIVWRSPEIWVSPPDQLLNRNTNQRGLYAYRKYAVGVEGFAACALVTRA